MCSSDKMGTRLKNRIYLAVSNVSKISRLIQSVLVAQKSNVVEHLVCVVLSLEKDAKTSKKYFFTKENFCDSFMSSLWDMFFCRL
jgi:hypothetical protein